MIDHAVINETDPATRATKFETRKGRRILSGRRAAEEQQNE
jgi:hypothetical protein